MTDAALSAERKEARAALEKRGIPAASVMRMRPWLLALTLSISEMQAIGWNPEGGVDKRLLDRARGRPGQHLGRHRQALRSQSLRHAVEIRLRLLLQLRFGFVVQLEGDGLAHADRGRHQLRGGDRPHQKERRAEPARDRGGERQALLGQGRAVQGHNEPDDTHRARGRDLRTHDHRGHGRAARHPIGEHPEWALF